MEAFTEKELKEIFKVIYDKVRSLQINHYFDITLEKERQKTYIGMSDDFFFKQLCDLTFQSGLRGQIWLRFEPEIKKEFKNYEVKKVAGYTQKDIKRMLHNPKMLKHRKKIESCVYNARKMFELSDEYSGFWHWLDSRNIEELVGKLRGNFKWMGYTNAYAFLRYVGMDIMKPDLNVRRILFRLGLTDNMTPIPQTFKQIQEIGKRMAETSNVRIRAVDYTLFMFGAGEKPFVKYAICGKVPKCDECSLTRFCDFYQGKEACA